MANWMQILAQALGGGRPRRREKKTPPGMTPPFSPVYEDDGYTEDSTMFDRFRSPVRELNDPRAELSDQTSPNPMPKLIGRNGKWTPETIDAVNAWQARQKEIESQPGYRYEPPLLGGGRSGNGAVLSQPIKQVVELLKNRNNEDDSVRRPDESAVQAPQPNINRTVKPQSTEAVPESPKQPIQRDSLDGDIMAMEDAIRAAYSEPITNRKANWMQKMGRGLRKFQKGWAGGKGGLVGGFSAALDPTLDERMNRQTQLNEMFDEYSAMRKMKQAQQQEALTQEQIDAIPENRRLRELQIQGINEDRDARRQGTARINLFKAGYFDPNNPVHAKLAQDAGLDPSTLKGWDFRNPSARKIGGIDYQYDRNTGSWSPINVDSNKLRAYDVVDPDGVIQRYMIPEEKAAQFAQQAKILGMRIQAASDLADKNNAARTANIKLSGQMRMALMERGKALERDLRIELQKISRDNKNADAIRKAQEIRDQLAEINGQLNSPE